ncbi:DNA repair protein UVH3 [Apium graveolens]|uniref:DNA repair protein UVH3 n=1 Tax=Apium graveolens TaxID=4045 RepID=UPI003D7B4621
MGVRNLWELLSPVGRRVNVETLAGKKLAIDASIWMIQFMKAMRDEKGEMVKNAHILGFFRRICKLLFLRVKPVFVFDGAAPALKRRTVAARRRLRDNAQTNIRKTAEKLLLNHMKTHRLQKLAENLEEQRQQNNAKGKGKRKFKNKAQTASQEKEPVSKSSNQEAIDEMLAASPAAEEDRRQMNHASTPAADAKGKRKIADIASEGKEPVSGSYNQEAIDEMLAASLAAEEGGSQIHHASTSAAAAAAAVPHEEEDDDADEEMILPTMDGKMDPAVLAALPPSMQLDLLAQMRERLMAENRQKYQKVKKAPERFSELQIQSYLKTVAFRRDIDEVRKSAAGKGIGGVQTSRIASEANRQFIYSSSFTGDKDVLASAGLDQNSSEQQHMPVAPSSSTPGGSVPAKKSSASGSVADQSSNTIHKDIETADQSSNTIDKENETSDQSNNTIHKDIETYVDERGRVRVSRVRAMGLRMTRDLQRNLDLMKETEVESSSTALDTCFAGVSEELSCKMKPLESLDQGDDDIAAQNRSEEFINTRTPLEVTFDVNGENRDDDDDLFTRLVAGDSDLGFCSDEELLEKQCSISDSDCEWEEGVILDKNNIHHELEVGAYPSTMDNRECHEINLEWEEGLLDGQKHASSCLSDHKETDMQADAGTDVEWEDGSSDIPEHTFSFQPIYKEVVSKGDMEEEINFQEAIKRSLEELGCEKYVNVSSEDIKHTDVGEFDIPNANGTPSIQSKLCTDVDSHEAVPLDDRAGGSTHNIQPNKGQNGSGSGMYYAERKCVKSGTPNEEKGAYLDETKSLRSSSQIGQVHSGNNCTPGISSDSVSPDLFSSISDVKQYNLKTPAMENFTGIGEFTKFRDGETISSCTEQSMADGDNDDVVKDVDNFTEHSVMMASFKEQVGKQRDKLKEEMQRLGKERVLLGDERRKLERNAEAPTSEMYTECQELLQMFGLPYIIAPMEAEAQCAFMELENLVDGVVTDDSDVFLFGARSVFKNIFDDRKYVETYLMKDIEKEFGLTREKLIRMALLLGSDYTEGVSGIGIVNAIEVINAFPEEDGLCQFREWIESPDPSILGKVVLPARSNLDETTSKAEDCSKSSLNCSSEGAVPGPVDDLLKIKQHFMNKHRKVSKNWHIPSNFPSQAVMSAYDSPKVDKSTETFSWGKPDLFVLRKLCSEKFGWPTQKADDLLLPVLKEYNKHETQLRMEAFYSFNERFAKIRSKRIKEAVKLTMGDESSGLMDDTMQGNSKGRKKRKASSGQAGSGEDVSIPNGLNAGHESKCNEVATADSKKKRIRKEPCTYEGRNSESVMQEVGRQNTNGGSKSRGRGRNTGRGRGRGRDLSGKRGRKVSSTLKCAEVSSSDESDRDPLLDEPYVKNDRSRQVRRSTRPRKAVMYAMNDLDDDELVDASPDIRSSVDVGGKELLAKRVMGTSYHASDNELKHHESDHMLVETSSDFIQSGSGLCQNEAEVNICKDHVKLDQNGCTHSNADEDYLKKGGGFSFKEDDVGNETGKSAYSPTHSNADEDYLLTGGGFCMEEDDADKDTGKTSHSPTHSHSNADDDYLITGGGFCFEEDVGKDTEKSAYSPTHSNADKDYLKKGGGFCFEEDVCNDNNLKRNIVHDNDTGKSADSPSLFLHNNDNPSNFSVLIEDTDGDIRYDASQSVSNLRSVDEIQAGGHRDKPYDMLNLGNSDVTNTDNKQHVNQALSNNIVAGDNAGARSGQFLSAMPNLRRKRKS